ncbi:sensory box histidine kinase [Lysobacter enzymogenes]|uniref:Sensory/regulatory protein RpfC n=1 Tax=Lysobacter enzymogenes TaxID=69 RepID=A0A0S2DPM9_LYSEN|nr:ATP-binding protein [Lysobacter enzymogenes]ALN60506.1 sensory box histidine kinase [Lysobacter enzymogenes]
MFVWLDRISIRRQLWGLFALFLAAGSSVLLLDEFEQHRGRAALQTLQDDSLSGLRLIKTISDAYGLDVVDTTFRVRNDLVGWDEGVGRVDRARARIDAAWRRLDALPHSPREQQQLAAAGQARRTADAAAQELRAILMRRDLPALGRFADTRLYPAIDPLTQRMQKLSDLELIQADAVVRADIARSERVSALRIAVSLLALTLAALVGRRVLRNASRGIDQLTWLARRMREHDYTADPGELPPGELGAVMQTFLDMRRDVLGFETELTGQLIRNERTRAELERRERFQASLLDSAQTAIMAVDAQGRFTLVNPFAERLLGLREADAVGRAPLHSVFEGRALRALASELGAQLGRPVAADWTALRELARAHAAPRETRLRHRDGTWVPALVAVSATGGGDDEPPGLLVIAADLSALKRLERELRASEARAHDASRAKSSFLAAMSHEIRTPMIGVTGMIEVLAHSRLDPGQRQALEVIQQSSQSLLQIIGDILDLSKIEAGRLELAPAPLDLAALVRATVAGFLAAARARGLALDCEVDARVAAAYRGDALRLRQILGNFLSNAVKFTERGRIEAALEFEAALAPAAGDDAPRDRLCLRVSDTGVGIDPQQQRQLFQPFQQADADTAHRYGGTGLGLAICRRLAELMGGRIELHSEPGVGTTLRLHLELARAQAAELAVDAVAALPARAPPDVERAAREGRLTLLVDDHPTNRLVLAQQLALAGYACETAAGGEDALRRWRGGRYALVLTDLRMPGMDGYALARAIRAEQARAGIGAGDPRRTPILALTASALKDEADACVEAGMDDCLVKPLAAATLAAALRRWIAPERADAAPAQPAPTLAPGRELGRLLDLDTLHGLLADSGGGDAATVLAEFLAAADDDLAGLHRARADDDAGALHRHAHRLKGAAQLVGAQELAEAAQALEHAVHAQDRSLWAALLGDAESALQRLRRLSG